MTETCTKHRTKRQVERHVVCGSEELGPGEIRSFRAGKRRLAVMRLEDGSCRTISDSCPHQGASMGAGAVERMWTTDAQGRRSRDEQRHVAICPWHNFEFDVETGLTPNVSPRLRVKTYQTEVEEDEVVVYV